MSKSKSAITLEDGFFLESELEQLQKIQADSPDKDPVSALRACSNINSDAVLTHLVELGIAPETLSAMTLVPLIAVAWADGKLAADEATAILQGADKAGVEFGSAAHGLLHSWLTHAPDDTLVEAWSSYVAELLEKLSADERVELHTSVMGRARTVAEAAGGFLGLSKISKAEETMLDRLDNAFHGS